MRRPSIKRMTAIELAALASAALALPLQASAESGQTAPGKPLVSTAGAAHVKPPSALLQGSVDPRTLATTYYFEYGPTVAYGSRTPTATLAPGTARVRVSQTVTGIALGYHFRLVATNADGTRDGRDRTITTNAKPAFFLPQTFKETPLGGTFILTGRLTAVSSTGRLIVLQGDPYPYRGWANVGAPITTDATGRFAFHVAKLMMSTKFRVATVNAKPIYSPVVPELVTVRTLLKVRTSKSAPGLVRLYGTVTPAEAGAKLFVQLEKPPKGETEKAPSREKLIKPEKKKKKSSNSSGGHKESSEKLPTFLTEFTGIVKRGTRSLSHFSLVEKIRTTGHYRVFIVVRPGPVASGASQTVYLHAPPGANKNH
ncbi:MAG TPA: hypothetical protein VMB05_00300, partial [Solirubrobacteraceae bacterium]|nr:hypothetical protein [Solirubrobacteraceae bacterium]